MPPLIYLLFSADPLIKRRREKMVDEVPSSAKRARPSSVDDVILAQEAPAAKAPSRPGHKGMMMMTLAEV